MAISRNEANKMLQEMIEFNAKKKAQLESLSPESSKPDDSAASNA